MVDFARASEIIASSCALVRVRRASRALTRLYDEALRPSGLQATQLTMLVAVATCGDGGVKLGALADGLVMDRTTLTRNLAPLERAGLLRVARAPDDARVRLIFLTRQGERAIEAAFPLWERTQKHVRERLGPSEADALREELGRVVALAARPEKAPASERRARPARPAKAPARERPARLAKPAQRKSKRRSPEAR
ncbi:MarR family winged helix-turn-helix transcriptional regulator [Sorangium sp. So ce341]|uniref:MarR family winged helix-turn-helix transcriptional regulator n=1 Tax=Sorangium sp. So ce341 TaxID=3133302 RepID=UPI003F5D5EEE